MKKRRENYAGTLTRLSNGKYLAQIRIRGTRYSKRVSSRVEGEDWFAEMRAKHLKGQAPSSETPCSKAAQEWLAYKQKSLKPRSYYEYEGFLNRAQDYWGDRTCSAITSRDVREFLQEFDNQIHKNKPHSGWARRTEYAHEILRMFFSHLVADGVILTNPVSAVPRPKHVPRPPQILNSEGLQKILQVEGFEDQIGRAIVIGFAFALRRGEVLGLRWQDIDFERKQVHIVQQATAIKGKMVLSSLKTASSNRIIPLHPYAEKILAQQFSYVETLKAFAGSRWQENDLVFPSKIGTLWDSSQFGKAFQRRREKLGLSVRFHDLRHTAASWMVAKRGITAAQKLLGHAQSTTTLLYYTHSIEPPQSSLSILDESFFQNTDREDKNEEPNPPNRPIAN